MTRIRRSVAALLMLVALTLVACGGGGAPAANDPAGVVRQAFSLMSSKDLNGLDNLACAAQKGKILDSFAGGLSESGLDPQQMLNAMNFDTSKLTVGAVTENGDTATVALGGTMSFTFDEAKMRDVMKAVLAAQGQPTDDATVNAAMTMLTGMLGQPIPMDGQTMDLVREGGAWKICDQS